MNNSLQHLFVYGTLAPGEPNAHVLGGIDGHWQRACVKGHLKSKGWGANQGFPGIQLDEQGEIVNGWLFSSRQLTAHWQRLDEFEGVDYQRVSAKATLSNSDIVIAQIYQIVE